MDTRTQDTILAAIGAIVVGVALVAAIAYLVMCL
jgi:hypothetical protein